MRNQTALEYLVIIAAVIAVSAIVVFLVTGSAGTSQRSVLYSSCKQAATQCALLRKTNPNDPCLICEQNCVDPRNGQELESCIITACKTGNASLIYEGANFSFGECSADIDCDDGNACTIDSCVPFNGDECNKTCTYTQITQCINDDGCCPAGCSYLNDNDCADNPPTLTNGEVSPSAGLTIDGTNSNDHDGTLFTFSVTYTDADNEAPNYVRVNIDGTDYDMTTTCTDYSSGCVYTYSTKFNAPSASHSYSFKTASGASPEITLSGGAVTAYVCGSDSDCLADTTCKNYYCSSPGTSTAACEWVAQNEGQTCNTIVSKSCSSKLLSCDTYGDPREIVTSTDYYTCKNGDCLYSTTSTSSYDCGYSYYCTSSYTCAATQCIA